MSAAAAGTALLFAALTGCSDGEAKSVPALPERICWGVFASKDVARLLPTGEKATINTGPFSLPEDLDKATCSLYIDGNTKFQASATYENFERGIDWSSWDPAKPVPIDAGVKGIVWYSGAASYIACQPSASPSTPGKYIDLKLSVDSAEDDTAARAALPELMKQFVAFAERELKCA